MAPPPVVTGISPKEGPPGTRITIRGEFLGTRAQDLIGLKICECECLLSAEWKSQNKIIARSGPCKGRGDIIVTTQSGGQGTSTVQFRGYHETIGPMKESAVWVEEAPVLSFVWGRRALSPTNYQQEDPLGLSVEGNEKKFPEDELIEHFGEASGELTSDKFHPGMFLLQHHHATTFDDLKAGLSYLQRKVNSQKEGQLSFLKANVGSVMEQLETIMLLKEQFEADLKNYGENPMEKLEAAIKQSMLEANKLFDDVLARRDRADATRNALSVMQRYKFLFCMPVNIEKNMKNGNYDLVINDYARVKNLFKNTDVDIFKKVLREIEYRIETLREVLRKKLEEPCSLEEQKKIIRHLINLEAEGDPAWDAIVSHANHLEKSIKASTNEYLDNENRDDNYRGGTVIKSNASTPMSIKQFKLTRADENNAPFRVQCIEELCEIVMEQLPDLWRLGQSYFTGQLHVAVDTEKQGPFKSLVLSSIQHAVDAMNATCDSELDASWLLQNLKCIRHMYASLIHLDLPSDALDLFENFIFDLRLQCLLGLFKETADNVIMLNRKETWNIEYTDDEEGITLLPSMFEDMVEDVVKLGRETAMTCGPRESPLLADFNQQSMYHEAVKSLFSSFARCLQQLAFSGSEDTFDDEVTTVSQLTGSPAAYRIRDSKMHGPTWEQCLLISLSNIRYTLKVVLPRIEENLKTHGYPDLSSAIGYKSDWTQLETLDNAVLEAYLERRCDPLVGTIEPNMYVGNLDWTIDLLPTHVKPYAQEILDNLITVHAEVRRISPRLLQRVLSHMIETISEELARLITCVNGRFSSAGIIQARTDIFFLKKALNSYCTPKARNFFEEASKAIPQPASQGDAERIEILLTKVNSRMRLQLSCLITDADSNVDNVEYGSDDSMTV
ncbi:exocyst complex component 2 [Phymastichus coffea]|uniref:exocyst complex component 2 n=1 Tax=Phymastichus coffea TaxID=108790 RepID=UPI00273B1B29|nr:exocyst complex component 2 [Phymastichus coffea]